MAKIAFCWELGGGLGHITGFLAIANLLRERGHEVVYIIRDLLNTGELIGQHGFKIFQAPCWHPRVKNLPDPVNYAEILFRFGFLSEDRLFDMVMGWENIFQLINPDLAIFDHSPTALVASRKFNFKKATFGTGFCIPPKVDPMPTIRPWSKPSLQRLQSSEKKALEIINAVLGRTGVAPLNKFMDFLVCDEEFLTTFPQLDHYQNRGKVNYWGPYMSMDEGDVPVWPPKSNGKRIFAYLKGGVKGIETVLQVLRDIDASVLIYATGFSPAQIKKFQTEKLIFSSKMLNLKKVCQQCDLVICHAGHATVARALVEGIPVVMLPTQVEQFLLSARLARFGLGTMVNHQDKQPDYAGAIQRALNEKSIKQKAKEFAARYANFDQEKQIRAIVSRIEELVHQSNET